MLAHFLFRRKDGSWEAMLKKNFSLFLFEIKQGKVDAVNAETLTPEEAKLLGNEGSDLVPEEIVVGIGVTRRPIKIFKIERS